MVDLQKEQGPMDIKNRLNTRKKLFFNSDRTLKFEMRSVKSLSNRDFGFKKFRRLHYDINIEGVEKRSEQAHQYNIEGVKYYKEGKFKEAKWAFSKALSVDPNYQNAKTNLKTIEKKLKKRKKFKRSEAKKGRKFKDISNELRVNEEGTPPDHGDMQQQAAPVSANTQQQAAPAYKYQQPQRISGQPGWSRDYRCPGCSIPVRDNWIMCTNCGTDLRRYPPIPY